MCVRVRTRVSLLACMCVQSAKSPRGRWPPIWPARRTSTRRIHRLWRRGFAVCSVKAVRTVPRARCQQTWRIYLLRPLEESKKESCEVLFFFWILLNDSFLLRHHFKFKKVVCGTVYQNRATSWSRTGLYKDNKMVRTLIVMIKCLL